MLTWQIAALYPAKSSVAGMLIIALTVHRLQKRFTPNCSLIPAYFDLPRIQSRYTNRYCYQAIFWCRSIGFPWRSERPCQSFFPVIIVVSFCLLPWPAFAFCWAGLLMPRGRIALPSRAKHTTSRVSRAPAGPGPMPTICSLTATQTRPLARRATWW